jgi:hypothetical protein
VFLERQCKLTVRDGKERRTGKGVNALLAIEDAARENKLEVGRRGRRLLGSCFRGKKKRSTTMAHFQ